MLKPPTTKYYGRIPTRINDWYFAKVEGERRPCVKGKHYVHSKTRAGEQITTAVVRDFYYEDYSLRIICEDGMEYMLGKISPGYEEKRPEIIEKTKALYEELNSEQGE